MPKMFDIFYVKVNSPAKKEGYLVVFNDPLEMVDSQTGDFAIVAPGTYEAVVVPNPFGHEELWLMIEKSGTGAVKSWWMDQEKLGVIYLEKLIYP